MMRKNLIRLVLITAVMAGWSSCETERKIFKGPYFVRFTQTAMTQKESFSKPIEVEMHMAGPALSDDVEITYTVSGTAREGIDYVIEGQNRLVEIEAGDYVGHISISLINNSNNILRSQDLILKLLTVDTPGLQVGQGASGIGATFTLTIQDDCILGGNYYGIRSVADVPITDITITSSNCEEYLLSNWDINVFQFSDTRDLVFIDNGDNTLTIPPQEESTLAPEQATIDGSGVVDPTTRTITFSVRLVDFDDQPVVTFKLIPD
jgi:hypothetical protein